MPENIMLQEAIEAVRKGQRGRARDLLTRLLRADQSNPEYWLWMSAVVDTLKERVYCLQTVLQFDPGNTSARRGLVLLGVQPPEAGMNVRQPARRQWEAPVETASQAHGLSGFLAKPAGRILSLGGLALVVLGLILGGSFAFSGRRAAAPLPSRSPGPLATFTATPTLIPSSNQLTPTPAATFSGPTPLWMGLAATYTPTPLYVSTPHSVSEAFRSGLRAYGNGDWSKALTYFRQASQVEPGAADIQYYIGEAERFMGNLTEAKAAYEQAISINPGFAPAYLGRARARLALNPKDDVTNDLQTAITKDPSFGEAYLERAVYWLSQGKPDDAISDLAEAGQWLPASPWIPLYRAQAALQQGQNTAALDYARQANQIDVTLLPAYLTLGQAALAGQEYEAAIHALETYVAYLKANPTAWTALGQAYLKSGQADKALTALDRALKIDEHNLPALISHGLANLALGNGQTAVNDLATARQLSPRSFDANLGLGQALLASGQPGQARDTFTASLALAKTDTDRAAVFFWRAQALETLGNPPAAFQDWQALLALPPDAAQQQWLTKAQERISALNTPTRTSTSTPTPRASLTPRPSTTPTQTATLKVSPSPTTVHGSVTPSPSPPSPTGSG